MPSGTSSSGCSFLQPGAVFRTGDLAADAAAARGIRHQHRIAAGERKVRCERRALGAALFLHHLHQHHLPALDDFLDLVLAAVARRAIRHFLHGVGAADRFDVLRLFVVAVVMTIILAIAGCGDVLAIAFVGRVVSRRSLRRPLQRSGSGSLAPSAEASTAVSSIAGSSISSGSAVVLGLHRHAPARRGFVSDVAVRLCRFRVALVCVLFA